MQETSLLSIMMSWGPFILYYLPALILAYYVHQDAKNKNELALNVPPLAWGLICIVSGVLGALAYWVMNNSNLNPNRDHGSLKI